MTHFLCSGSTFNSLNISFGLFNFEWSLGFFSIAFLVLCNFFINIFSCPKAFQMSFSLLIRKVCEKKKMVNIICVMKSIETFRLHYLFVVLFKKKKIGFDDGVSWCKQGLGRDIEKGIRWYSLWPNIVMSVITWHSIVVMAEKYSNYFLFLFFFIWIFGFNINWNGFN